MSTLDVLKGAREILADKKRWIKGLWVEVQVVDGQPVLCHCVDGAVEVASGNRYVIGVEDDGSLFPVEAEDISDAYADDFLSARNALTAVAKQRGFTSHIDLNDKPSTTHADVLSLLDETIAAVAAEEVPF